MTEKRNTMNIALLDNVPDQVALITATLKAAGHRCQHVFQADQLLAHLHCDDTHMLIIDWQTTQGHGLDLLKTVCSEPSTRMPVLCLTGKGSEDDMVAALEAGANDYMLKPLHRGELMMRTTVLLKRGYPELSKPEQLQFGPYSFETSSGRASLANSPITLTQKEFALALLFFRHLGRPLSRAYIMEAVWPDDAGLSSRTMDTHVSRVRTKLGLRPENGFRLAPVYSYGYQLERLSR